MPPNFAKSSGVYSSSIPYRATWFESVTNPILNALEAPQQVAFSLAAGDLENALRAGIPFGGSRHIGVEEVTGSTNPWINYPVLLAADPLLFVGGVAKAPTALKQVNRIRDLNILQKTAFKAGRGKEAIEFGKKLKQEIASFKKLPAIEKQSLHRSIVSMKPFVLGPEVHLGDTRDVTRLLNKATVGTIPEYRQIRLKQSRDRIALKKLKFEKEAVLLEEAGHPRSAKTKRKKANELQELQVDLERKITQGDTVLSPKAILWAHKKKKGLKAKFSHKLGPEVTAIEDLRKVATAEKIGDLSATESRYWRQLEDLAEKQGLELQEQYRRIHLGAEARNIGDVPAARLTLNSEAQQKLLQASEKAEKDLAKLDRHTVGFQPNINEQKNKILANLDNKVAQIKLDATTKHLHFDGVVQNWGKLIPEEISLIDGMGKNLEKIRLAEHRARITYDTFDSNFLSYVPRILSPEAKKLKARNKTKYALLVNHAKVHLGHANVRKVLPETSLPEVNKILREDFGLTFDLFDENIIKAVIAREAESIKAVHKAQAVLTAVEMYAKPNLKRGKNVKKFLRDLNLNPGEIKEVGLPAIPANLMLPRNIYDDLTRMDHVLTKSAFNDKGLMKTLNFVDKEINSWFRLGLTSPFPGFHFRNHFSNKILNAMGGVPISGSHYTLAAKLLKAKSEAHLRRGLIGKSESLSKTEEKLWTELLNHRVVRDDVFGEIIGLGKGTRAEDILDAYKIPVAGPWMREGRRTGNLVETHARIAHYLYKKSRGATSVEAMRSVNRYLFDYSRLTPFEQQILRPNVLFYTWLRNNIPLMVHTSITNPRLINTWNKLTHISEDDAPNYLRESSVLTLGNTFINDPGMPMADLKLASVGSAKPDWSSQVKRLFQKFASRAAPMQKLAIELISGESAFSGRPIRDIGTGKWLLDQLPTSRLTRTTTRLIDPDEPVTFALLNALTGFKKAKIDRRKGREQALIRKGLRTGKLREYKHYGRHYKISEDDPVYKALQKALKEIRK